MTTYQDIHTLLAKSATSSPEDKARFFKIGVGHYSEHDKFLGVTTPILRKFAKEFATLSSGESQLLLESSFNEERLLALLILVHQYDRTNDATKENIYQFYLKNINHINNWNLVDNSAHLIIGRHLLNTDKDILVELSKSEIMWHRRIAIVATWYFIRNNQFDWTLFLAKDLLADSHDLIHKAVGWMLREMGKKDASVLIKFLEQYAPQMPRVMLRYAIERFPEEERKGFLKKRH